MTTLPTDLIDIRTDARAVDETAVAGLAESIASVGLINPIRVRSNGDRWELIAGAHRLAACRQLGLAEIECAVVTDDDLHAELAMIDENLCRSELSPAERARQTARRKAIYIELHPDTGRGGDHKSTNYQTGEFDRQPSFVANTATATDRSVQAVYRDVQRGEKIIDEAIDLIRGSKLDTGLYLDKIKGLSPNDQIKAVKRDLAHVRQQERDRASGIARRIQPVHEQESMEKWLSAGQAWWNRAPQEWRDEFIAWTDVPVMDRSAA